MAPEGAFRSERKRFYNHFVNKHTRVVMSATNGSWKRLWRLKIRVGGMEFVLMVCFFFLEYQGTVGATEKGAEFVL